MRIKLDENLRDELKNLDPRKHRPA